MTTQTLEDVIEADTRDEAEQVAREIARARVDFNGEAESEAEARERQKKIQSTTMDILGARASVEVDTTRPTTRRAVAHPSNAEHIVL